MDKQEIINELCKLYQLQKEGKNLKSRIQQLEELLFEVIDDKVGSEKTNAPNKEGR